MKGCDVEEKMVQIDLSQFKGPKQNKSISFDALTLALVSFIAKESDEAYVIGVGTDSQVYGNRIVFVTAIYIHRVGKYAIYFYNRFFEKGSMSLVERMYQEANLSLIVGQKLAGAFSSIIKSLDMSKYHFEIHVDVGMNGDTRTVVREIVGWIEGCGFMVKFKPDAACASAVADRHT
jgi:uncharacterized protein